MNANSGSRRSALISGSSGAAPGSAKQGADTEGDAVVAEVRGTPTMAHVADLAGVSHQTVSRVLNDSPHVASATRRRVRAAMAELGYRPNPAAQALVTRRTRTIGVVASDATLYGPASTLMALEEAARASGYVVSAVSLRRLSHEAVTGAVEHLTRRSVDGLVVLTPQRAAAAAVAEAVHGVPVVTVEGDHDIALPLVCVDQRRGAQLATQHLLDLGHATVWHVAGPGDWLEAEARSAGWRDTLAGAGVEPPEPLLGDWSAASGYRAGQTLAERTGPELTAVFVANDQMALGVLRALREAGRDVPRTVSVVGFDDVPEAGYFSPPLTTVRQDFAEVGRRAIELLVGRLESGTPKGATRIVVPPELVVRLSTGPPGAGMSSTRSSPDPRSGGGAVSSDALVVGIDFGTLSGRAVVVRVRDGAELGSGVHEYANGVIEGRLPGSDVRLGVDDALQLPDDWREVLRRAVPAAIAAAGVDPGDVVGVGTDFTACTFVPALRDGTPLCELDDLRERPHAYPKLWRHHSAQSQADRISELAHERGEPWIDRYGGRISSEWEFAKALEVLEEDPEVYARTYHFVEAADWIIWQLCGVETRNACTLGYKGIYQDGHYPSREYLATLNPGFADFCETKLMSGPAPLGGLAGRLTAEAAGWTGLPEGIAVAVGNVDAHVTSAAANAVEPGQMVAVMGTSTCHVMNGAELAVVPGMCGVVRDGIVSGLWGYEAGQSGVGDIFAWVVRSGVPPEYEAEAAERGISLHTLLTEKAESQGVGEHGLVVLDWHSGNRSVLVDHDLSGVIVGLTLATRPEDVYRATVEATAFGTRLIVETFEAAGVPVEEFIAAGGLVKNPFVMQVYADAMRRPISVIGSDQGPALGSAIHAAVAAGEYPDVHAAAAAMGKLTPDVWQPDPGRADAYDRVYEEYRQLHDYFGRGGNDVLHRLRALRTEVRAARGAEVLA